MSDTDAAAGGPPDAVAQQLALGTAAARVLATTTKSAPQMRGITPRWLLRMLPWELIEGGAYRVNRRRIYAIGGGRVSFITSGARFEPIPPSLRELSLLAGYDDDPVLATLAARFEQLVFAPGETIVQEDQPADRIVLIAHGRANKIKNGRYGDPARMDTLAEGDHVGDQEFMAPPGDWRFSVAAVTPCTVLSLPRASFDAVLAEAETLRTQMQSRQAALSQPQDRYGQAAIDLAAGHSGEPALPGTFADYDASPREYELSLAQTVLQIHTRVADLFNEPMNQIEQQLRLTIEALRETQESELINNPGFGLLHNVDPSQRVQARGGPPTPDDLDELLSRRRTTKFFLAHPRTIASFGQECTRRGLYPETVEVEGRPALGWRGAPILPSDKIPIRGDRTSPILVMRTGLQSDGVIGLQQTGLPDEYQPGLTVRFMGLNEKAILSYLVTAYYSVAVLVPDALGMLENAVIGRVDA